MGLYFSLNTKTFCYRAPQDVISDDLVLVTDDVLVEINSRLICHKREVTYLILKLDNEYVFTNIYHDHDLIFEILFMNNFKISKDGIMGDGDKLVTLGCVSKSGFVHIELHV